MKYDIDAFENEQNRLAALYAMQDRVKQAAQVDEMLRHARRRPAPIRGPSRPQIAVTVALALCLGLALGVIAERTWTETNAAEVQK